MDILPSSWLREPKRSVPHVFGSIPGTNAYCANCGRKGPLIPDVSGLELRENFHCWLCDACAEKWGPLLGLQLMPDEAFFQKVKEAQLEKYQRELTPDELLKELSDPNSTLSKLARERR